MPQAQHGTPTTAGILRQDERAALDGHRGAGHHGDGYGGPDGHGSPEGQGLSGVLKPDGDLLDASALLAEIDGLRQRLASQPSIEQAKGILMGHYGINNDTAFQLLRRWSQETNTKIRHIAELLTESAADGAGSRRAPHQVIEQELPGRQLSAR